MGSGLKMVHRSKAYQIVDQVLSSTTHGFGVLFGLIGFVFLIHQALVKGGALRLTSFIIYGLILIIFYLMSTLFHALYFTRAEKVFRIFDHISIYFLIAGTYTPYCMVTIQGKLGWTLLVIIWLIALFGVFYKIFWINRFQKLSTVMYVVMGWLCLSSILPLWNGLGKTGFYLLLFGGITYTVGAVIYSFKQIPMGHVIWHIFVLVASLLMYFSIYLYV